MYNADNLKVKPLPAVDTVSKGIITELKEGTFETFVEPEYISSFDDPEHACIQVKIETQDGYFVNRLFALPDGDAVSPKSDIGRFMSKYGAAPQIGMEVSCIYSKKGDKTFYALLI